MPEVIYSYPDTPVNIGRLVQEIEESLDITIPLERITTQNTTTLIHMASTLSTPEKDALDIIVANHQPIPLPPQLDDFEANLLPSVENLQLGSPGNRWDAIFATSGNFDTTLIGSNNRPVMSIIQASGSSAAALRVQSRGGTGMAAIFIQDTGDDGGEAAAVRITQNVNEAGLFIQQNGNGPGLRISNLSGDQGDIRFYSQFNPDPMNPKIGDLWWRNPGDGKRNALAFKSASGVVEIRQGDGIVSAYLDESVDTVSFTTTAAYAKWSNQTIKDSKFYSYPASDESIYVWVDGIYKISYTGAAELTNSNSRHTVQWAIHRNNQATVLPYTKTYSYHRTTADGLMSVSKTIFLQLNAGDRLRLQAIALTGAGTLEMRDGTSLTIEFVRAN